MEILAKSSLVARLAGGSVAGLLAAVGAFAVLQHLVDVSVIGTRPTVSSPVIAVRGPICDCFRPRPVRVGYDYPLLHELLTPLTSLVDPEAFTLESFEVLILIDLSPIESREAA